MSNGSAISVPDLAEGEILVPPPPSMAPPPPPPNFIPPPPDFMGDLNDPANLQPPSIPAPKPPSLPTEEDLTCLKPPPMAPPKPPSSSSSSSSISTSSAPISSPPAPHVPERPRYAPPQLPKEKQHKTQKTPPPKPTRLSSMFSFDSPPHTPAPPIPVQTPTVSSFNPQNAAKLYNVPTTSVLGGNVDNEARPKQILLLEDSGSVNSAQVPAQTNGKAPSVVLLSKPDRRNASEDLQEPKENLQTTHPAQSPLLNRKAKTGIVSAQQDVNKLLKEIILEKENSTHMNSEANQSTLEGSASQSRRFSPLLDRKLRNLKSSEISGVRDGSAASPLALLMAAKERDKHRSLSREDSANYSEISSSSIHQSDSNPNSFVITPRSSSSTVLTTQDILQQSAKSASPMEHRQMSQSPGHIRSPAVVRDEMPSTRLATDASASNVAVQRQGVRSPPAQGQADREEPSMLLLPPPPEFDDLDEIIEPPPSIPPPDPPKKKAPSPTVSPPAQGPSPLPNPKPPTPPKLPPPVVDIRPKPVIQAKPKVPPAQPPPTLSPSQTTLLTILQKKMLEMDHKMAPMKDLESASDDWGAPLSDEDTKVPVVRKPTPQNIKYAVVNKMPSLDMSELENKVAKKYQETSSVKAPTR